jgi:hypothetical protein
MCRKSPLRSEFCYQARVETEDILVQHPVTQQYQRVCAIRKPVHGVVGGDLHSCPRIFPRMLAISGEVLCGVT